MCENYHGPGSLLFPLVDHYLQYTNEECAEYLVRSYNKVSSFNKGIKCWEENNPAHTLTEFLLRGSATAEG